MSQLALNCSTIREIVPWIKGSEQRKVIFRIMDSNTEIYKPYISTIHPYKGHNSKWFVPNNAFFNLFCSDWSHYYVGQDPPISNFINLANQTHLQIHWAVEMDNNKVIENSAALVEAESKYWTKIRDEARGQLIEVQMTKLCDSKNLTYAALFYRWMATILLTRLIQSNPIDYVDDPSDSKRIYDIVSNIESACANAPPGIKGRTIEGYCSNLAKWYLIMHIGSPLYEYGQVLRKGLKTNTINVEEFTVLPLHKWFSAIVLLQGVTEKEKILKLKGLLYELCKATSTSICIEILAALEPLMRNVARPATVPTIEIDTPNRCKDISYQENGKVYCFELNQLIDILKSPNPINPYTGNKFDPVFVEKMLRKFNKPSITKPNNAGLCTSCKNIIKNQPLRWGMIGDDAQKIVYEYCSMECFEQDEENIKILTDENEEENIKTPKIEYVSDVPIIDYEKVANQRDNVMTKFYDKQSDLLQKLLDNQDNMLNKQQHLYNSIADKIENLQRNVAAVQSKQDKRMDSFDAKLDKLSDDLQSSNKTVESLAQFVYSALENDKLEQKIESVISRALAENSKLQNNAIFNRIQQAVDDIKFSQRENVENVQKLLSQLPRGAENTGNTLDLLQNVTATVQSNAKQLENLQNQIQKLNGEIPTKIVNELGQAIKQQTDILKDMRTELPTLWAESAKKLEAQLKDTANEIVAKIVNPIDLLMQKALTGFLQELKVANSLFTNDTSSPDTQAAALLQLAQQRVADTYNALIEQIKTLTEQSSSSTKEILSNLADNKLLANVQTDNKESVKNAVTVWNSLANKVENALQEVNQKLSGLSDAEKSIANRLIAWQQTEHVKNPQLLLEYDVSGELAKQNNTLQSLDTKVTTLQSILENMQNSNTINKAHLLQLETASEKPEIIPEVESAVNEKQQNNIKSMEEISPAIPEYLLKPEKPEFDIDAENNEPYMENQFEINDEIKNRYDLEDEEQLPTINSEEKENINEDENNVVENTENLNEIVPIEATVENFEKNEAENTVENEIVPTEENEAEKSNEMTEPENEVKDNVENEIAPTMESSEKKEAENSNEEDKGADAEPIEENDIKGNVEFEEKKDENFNSEIVENLNQEDIVENSEAKIENPTSNILVNELKGNAEVPKLDYEGLIAIRDELRQLKNSAGEAYLTKFNIKAFNPLWAERYLESKESDNEILGQESPHSLLLFVTKLMLIIARYITRDPNILRLSDKRTLEAFNNYAKDNNYLEASDKLDRAIIPDTLQTLLNLPYIHRDNMTPSVQKFFNIKENQIPIDLIGEILLKEAYQKGNTNYETKFDNIIENIVPVIKTKFDTFFSKNIQYLLQTYDKIIEGIHNDNPNIISYIKIRNDDEVQWNQRFRLYDNDTNKILTVQYNDSQIPFYVGKKAIWDTEYENNFVHLTPATEFRVYYNPNLHTMTVTPANNDKKIIQKWSNVSFDIDHLDWRPDIGLIEKYRIATGSEKSIYGNTYLFGPFTEIFSKKDSLETLAKKSFKQIEPHLDAKKSICVVGYGASGAGKTSTLIRTVYKDKNGIMHNEDGVAVHWCNFLPDKWKFLHIIVKEFYTEKDREVIANKQNVTFERKSGIWMSSGQTLSTFLEDNLNDENRKISATPNNIVSSRSHVIIYIKLLETKNDEILQAPCIAICDFAGVENKFECENPDVLNKFLNLPQALNENVRAYDAIIKQEFVAETNAIIYELKKLVPADSPTATLLSELLKASLPNSSSISNILAKAKQEFKQYDNFYKLYVSYTEDIDIKRDFLPDSGPLSPLETLNFILDFLKDIQEKQLIKSSIIEAKNEKKRLNDPKNKKLLKPNELNKQLDKQDTKIKKLEGELINYSRKYKDAYKYYNSSEFKWIMNVRNSLTSKEELKYLKNIKFQNVITENEWLNLLSDIIFFIILLIWHDTETSVIAEECTKRTLEGTFINQSLSAMRSFIQQLGRHEDTVPGFIDQCLPLQCNPYYNQCLGSSDNTEWQNLAAADDRGKKVMKMIYDLKETLGLLSYDRKDKVVFCLMNIVNISQERNNPPNPPYLDITGLLLEQNRLLTLKNKNNNVLESQNSKPFIELSILEEFELRTKTQRDVLDNTMQESINTRIKQLKMDTDHTSILAKLIELINIINSNSAIGTMIAVDQMVKFGEQVVSCNLRYNNFNTDHDYFAEYNSFLQELLKKYKDI